MGPEVGGSPETGDCSEKMQLAEALLAATEKHVKCLRESYRNMGIVSSEDYKAALHTCDELREASDSARDALEAHIREHGC